MLLSPKLEDADEDWRRIQDAERAADRLRAALAHAREWVMHNVSGGEYQRFLQSNRNIEHGIDSNEGSENG
jgi:hypothetical protein